MVSNAAISTPNGAFMKLIHPENPKPLKTRKFVFSSINRDKIVTKPFRDVKIKGGNKGGSERYVEYYYRIPPDLRDRLPAELIKAEWVGRDGMLKEWARIKVKQNINRIGTLQYAEALRESVQDALQRGYSPFQALIEEYAKLDWGPSEEFATPLYSLQTGVDAFLEQYQGGPSYSRYKVIKKLLEEYFADRFKQSIEIATTSELTAMLTEAREEGDEEWSNNTYNDYVTKLRTLFKWLKKAGRVTSNPAASIDKLKGNETGTHTPFDKKTGALVKAEALKRGGEYLQLHAFWEVLYYTCTRPIKETRQLLIGDIKADRELLYIRKEIGKAGRSRFIPLVKQLAAVFSRLKLDQYPDNYYIFGSEGCPGPAPTKPKHFAELFGEIRKAVKLGDEYSNYGWKHTRIIDLYEKDVSLAELQKLCGHTLPSTTEKYMRKLGCTAGQIIHDRTEEF